MRTTIDPKILPTSRYYQSFAGEVSILIAFLALIASTPAAVKTSPANSEGVDSTVTTKREGEDASTSGSDADPTGQETKAELDEIDVPFPGPE